MIVNSANRNHKNQEKSPQRQGLQPMRLFRFIRDPESEARGYDVETVR